MQAGPRSKEKGKEIRQTNNKKILFSNYKISVWQVLQEIDRGVSLLSVFMCFYLFGLQPMVAAEWWNGDGGDGRKTKEEKK